MLLKRRIEGSYSRTGMCAFAEQPKKCSDRVKNVFVYGDCLYISLQFYDCEVSGFCPSNCTSHTERQACNAMMLSGLLLFVEPAALAVPFRATTVLDAKS